MENDKITRIVIMEPEHEVNAYILRKGKKPIKIEKKGGIYYAEIHN